MELRDGETADATRLHELARNAMTAAYALAPQQLDIIVESRFGPETLEDEFESDDTVVLVAENGESDTTDGDTTVGFVLGKSREDAGEIRWLFVDPEHRGMGVGTRLFEGGTDRLREAGADYVRATALEANTEGGTFFERCGLERTDERQIEIGEESFVEHVYTESAAAESTDDATEPGSTGPADRGDSAATDETDVTDADLPDTETREGNTVATTDDGTEVYLDREEIESGTEAPFLVAYTDDVYADQYGYYCGNCSSLDTAVGEAERIECAECGNSHTPRSARADDDSYL